MIGFQETGYWMRRIAAPPWLLLIAFCACAGTTGSITAAEKVERFRGTAVDEKGRIQYLEEQEFVYVDGRIDRSMSRYVGPDGTLIGELKSSYRNGPAMPESLFRDLRTGAEDGAVWTNSAVQLFRQPSRKSDRESKTVPHAAGDGPQQVIGQGFHHYLQQNLDRLQQGETLRVRLMLPVRLSEYAFRIRKKASSNGRLSLVFESDSWLLRWVAPNLELEYETQSGRLLRYQGRSNLDNANGESQDVVITYTFREPE